MPSITLQPLHRGQSDILSLFLRNEKIILRAGRRFGKTSILEWVAMRAALGGLKVGWFGPDYRRNRPTFDRIARELSPAVSSQSATFLTLATKAGGEIELWTLSDPDAGRSRSYDLVIMDEATLAVREITDVWEQAIRPTLIDRGGSAIMAATPKGIDPEQLFYRACTDKSLGWVEYHAPTAKNPFLDKVEIGRLKSEYHPLVYQQEILADFVDWGGEAFFSAEAWLVDEMPVAYPKPIDFVFATIDTALKTGREHDGTAVIYWARNRFLPRQVFVLDWDVVQIQGSMLIDWYPSVLRRMGELSDECNARFDPRGPYIEDASSGAILIQQARRQGMPVIAIDTKLTAVGKDERALSTVSYHAAGKVALTQYAADKAVRFHGVSRNHLMAQVIGYRPGQKLLMHDDLLDCYTYGLSLSLGNGAGW